MRKSIVHYGCLGGLLLLGACVPTQPKSAGTEASASNASFTPDEASEETGWFGNSDVFCIRPRQMEDGLAKIMLRNGVAKQCPTEEGSADANPFVEATKKQ